MSDTKMGRRDLLATMSRSRRSRRCSSLDVYEHSCIDCGAAARKYSDALVTNVRREAVEQRLQTGRKLRAVVAGAAEQSHC